LLGIPTAWNAPDQGRIRVDVTPLGIDHS
jgi:hypothetical protein